MKHENEYMMVHVTINVAIKVTIISSTNTSFMLKIFFLKKIIYALFIADSVVKCLDLNVALFHLQCLKNMQ